jgi:GTP-binding protein
MTKADMLDDEGKTKVMTELEQASGARVFPISAPLDEGTGPLLDAIIEHLGRPAESPKFDAPDDGENPWSPL